MRRREYLKDVNRSPSRGERMVEAVETLQDSTKWGEKVGGCRAALTTDEYHGYECTITGGACMFLMPNEKACYEEYGEGPLNGDEE